MINNCLTALDLFEVNPIDRLKFNSKGGHKTVVGGICTLFMLFVFLVVSYVFSLPIFDKDYVQFFTKVTSTKSDHEIYYKDDGTFRIFMNIEDAFNKYQIDRTKIDVFVE